MYFLAHLPPEAQSAAPANASVPAVALTHTNATNIMTHNDNPTHIFTLAMPRIEKMLGAKMIGYRSIVVIAYKLLRSIDFMLSRGEHYWIPPLTMKRFPLNATPHTGSTPDSFRLYFKTGVVSRL
ncbi:hypothetical protein NTGBS_490029 [Candidatus Nitrotoga sp. BS]|nr:hypothetical protein NTGBS_490029 [Candidatus Nitrotoga sp. BS]